MTPTYKLDELATLAGVSPRTVRYYVQRGLLPAPDFKGKDTAYGREHLLRLQAIKHLQEQRLPLDEIQAELAHVHEAELERLARGELAEADPSPAHRDSTSVKKGGTPYRSPGRDEEPPPPVRPFDPSMGDPNPTAHVYRLATGVELWVRSGLPAASRALVREILSRYADDDGKDEGR